MKFWEFQVRFAGSADASTDQFCPLELSALTEMFCPTLPSIVAIDHASRIFRPALLLQRMKFSFPLT